ncbi:MAG: hypothetical protein A2832_01215 [Candidatus Zambryskibacteria bacterium RIFCSPHIGHO2_01_FULL_44_22b]|uniref:Uncharacterized protein n=2 Tax=Candidatus Zambryskiibacteriota TaxID=1817925 RepID=A0A1G2SX89_9BACT|nr:MAG: hypothetical protein A2832_01215 [Candidatus Zambryskibacteria bacterium RIFCSPHIGHO2_01_FULL_44_22b]OHB04885.1 MAG: hypothetical protein A3B16_01590 [Candidatus Zambryskibacteria bacterium RIFCSPLOWO2_01_FULL_45_43]
MKKSLIILLLLVLGLIVFFWPKQKIFGCGAVCTYEGFEKTREEIAKYRCVGFEDEPFVSDATIKVCYGIFIER